MNLVLNGLVTKFIRGAIMKATFNTSTCKPDCKTIRVMIAPLGELKIYENTIAFYSSDKWAKDYRISNAANAEVGTTGTVREHNKSMYKGGIHTFGIVRWLGNVPAWRRD